MGTYTKSKCGLGVMSSRKKVPQKPIVCSHEHERTDSTCEILLVALSAEGKGGERWSKYKI